MVIMDAISNNKPAVEKNNLFPVFLKLEQLRLLIIGGGNVALEKLMAVLSNSPNTQIFLVAKEINESIRHLAATCTNVQITVREYSPSDVDDTDIVIVAVNDSMLSERIRSDAKQRGKLINVADTPALCDFYLGSVVTKGNLKLAISTNGKSPTMAKRLKELLNEVVPEEIDELLIHLHDIRENLKGDFEYKVKSLNDLTRTFSHESLKATTL
jgi:siroheme synthase-like protein